ncbi:MAG: sulfatase-like hydrolase/transferase [Verrucomicrobiota bacterium]
MKRFKLFLALTVLSTSSLIHGAETNERPNVIVIITDDQGYGDLSAHGNPVLKTPNMDQFRESAVRFTDFHVAPMCSPTRGQLMTGIDAMKNGCTAVCEGRSMMRADLPTMANFFTESGYATGHFGKWHLGDSYPHRPEDRGFQETIHHRAWGLTSLADHWENHTDVYFDPILSHNGVDKKFEGYCTDIFFDETMKWIDALTTKNQKLKTGGKAAQPFFVYLPTNTPHVPDIAPEKYLTPYVGDFEGMKMPTHFYGMIANLDENLGRLEAFLEEKKLKDNTIVIYMADNGTQSTAAKEIYNAGMREKKTSVYEGGHRVPFFIRWPNGELQHGEDITELVQVQDVLLTLIELCGLEPIDSPLPFDGTSLAGLLTGEATELPDRKLVVQYQSSGEPWDPAVVMWNEWRLLRPKKGRNPQPPNAPLELYNVSEDPGQTTNVISQNAEVAEAMKAHYEEWYAEAKPLFDKPRWITIGSEASNPLILYAQDWVGDYCDNPGGLSHATAQGYWNVEVTQEGIYEIGLRRWPAESNKTLTEGWAEGPGGVERSARPIAVANLQIAGSNHTVDVRPTETHATFRVKLPTGKTQLATRFMDGEDRSLCSAIYVYVNRVDGEDAALTPTSERKPLAAVAGTKPGVAKAVTLKKRDILIADFEGDNYGDWKVTGTAFGKGPTLTQDRIAGHQGKKLVDTFLISGRSDAPVGTLTSPPFQIERPYLNFLIGGGRHPGETGVALILDGKRVQTATGNSLKNSEGQKSLQWTSWDVSSLKGKEAQIEIFDNRKIGWGHIVVDQIFQSGQPAADSPAVVGGKPLEKTLTVDNTHLHIPVDNTADKQARLKLGIYDGETLVQNFDVAIPDGTPADWIATYPLDHFDLKGKTITIRPQDPNRNSKGLQESFKQIRIGDDLPDEKASDLSAPYQNQFHLAARKGWLNDPNGMLYHEGKYHLYYQHNPFGIQWGNMHWGHATSKDLVHWEHQQIALFQNTTADMMFSGGGFVDFNNSAGVGKDTLFVAFTSTGRGECLAYSQDGGMTFTEIPENPVVEHKGRDPKIFWYEPEEKWVMAVYSETPSPETEGGPEGKKKHFHFAFHESKDLRKWKRTGAFTDPDRDAVYECPDIFELEIGGEKKWVLYGAQTKYFIGEFDGKTFRKESGPFGGKADFWNTQHGHFYAAQNFSHTPDGRVLRVGWLKIQKDYTSRYPGQMTSQALSLPHELQLKNTSDGLRLAFLPIKELEALRIGELDSLEDCAGELTEVLIEFEEGGWHELMINGIDASFEGKSARIFTDRTFNEVFANDGLYYKALHRKPEKIDSTETKVKSGKIKSLKIYQLKSIWQ